MKRGLCILMALLMTGSLCACGANANNTETTASSVANSDAETTDTENSDAEITDSDYSEDKMGIGKYIESVESTEKITIPLYFANASEGNEIELLILNGIEDIPYISVENMVNLMARMWSEDFSDYKLEISQDVEGTILVTRDNESVMMLDSDQQTISFSDPDLFARMPGAANGLDINYIYPQDDKDGVMLLTTSNVLYRDCSAKEYRLADYNIYMHYQDGMIYVPLQTFSDVMLGMYSVFALYNRDCVIITNEITPREYVDPEPYIENDTDDSMSDEEKQEVRKYWEDATNNSTGPSFDLAKIYYAGQQGKKSTELSIFCYNELCMALDQYYGLKEEHQIESFDSLFKETGLSLNFLEDDAYTTFQTLGNLIDTYLADGHSSQGTLSYLAEFNLERLQEAVAAGMSSEKSQEKLNSQRLAYYPESDDGPVGYEEVGNTAIITFDSFSMDEPSAYYEKEITNTSKDTVELLIYANKQINRKDSPIENVVLDLTLNAGGEALAAVCVPSWLLGYCDLQLEDVSTGTQGIVRHQFDVNLDHEIDEQDCLLSNENIKGIYCLVSSFSFSCANLVPAALKGDPDVTIIGQTSGGGACCVQTLSSADGNTFNISGNSRINTVKNGSFYSVDQGVTPDIFIDNMSHLYDRQYLVDMINNLD